MGDAWGNPFQALIQARTPCSQNTETCLLEFLRRTAHNDSVKLVPTLLELLHTSLLDRWTIAGSRLLGLGCWTLVLVLLVHAHWRLQLTGIANRALPLFWLFLFSLTAGLERFATAFAIHRALPALCSVAAAGLLWVPIPARATRWRLPLLAMLCVISLFSFANGGWLFPLVALSLAVQRNRQWRWILVFGLLSLAPYLALFKGKHAAAMQASADPSIAKGLSFLVEFLVWPLQQTLQAVRSVDLLLAIPFGLLLAWTLWRGRNESTCPMDRPWSWQPPSALGFYSFLLFTYLPVPLLVTVQRGYSVMQMRYFVETTLFSSAIAGLLVLALQHPALRRFSLIAATAAVTLLALNSAHLVRLLLNNERPAGPRGLTCLKNSQDVITPATIRRCGVDREFVKWQRRPDPTWHASYADGLNALLRSRNRH